jgi:hypothetical protein
MPSRTQVTLDADLDRRAKARAAELGVSFAEYVRRLIRDDVDHARAVVALDTGEPRCRATTCWSRRGDYWHTASAGIPRRRDECRPDISSRRESERQRDCQSRA